MAAGFEPPEITHMRLQNEQSIHGLQMDYERLRMTLKRIVETARDAEDSPLRGYVLGLTMPIRGQLGMIDAEVEHG